jgi:uncharacterized protein (TIGR00661 family)
MNILYGMCGDGMGHLTRSVVVGDHLERAGHRVMYATHGNAYKLLEKRKPHRAISLVGLDTVIRNNRVSVAGTVTQNLATQALNAWSHIGQGLTFAACKPDVVITDFEPWTAVFATVMGKPLLAVDNVHFLTRCSHPPDLIHNERDAWWVMKTVTDAMVPAAWSYLVTTFAAAPITSAQTELHLPILRPCILDAKRNARSGDYVVAYFNNKAAHAALIAAMKQLGIPVHLYGAPRQRVRRVEGNVTVMPFSEEAFVADLAGAQAVIGGSGFTFMTEAIYLGKPMLALPYEGQFEQILNAEYLERMGYGKRAHKISAEATMEFVQRIPEYSERLRGFRHDGNAALLSSVESKLAAWGPSGRMYA